MGIYAQQGWLEHINTLWRAAAHHDMCALRESKADRHGLMVLASLQALHMPSSYYSVNLSDRWRLIGLDTTEMSLHSGYPEVR